MRRSGSFYHERREKAVPVYDLPRPSCVRTGNEDRECGGAKSGEGDGDAVQEKIEEAILSEFDFDEIEQSLQEMFPDEKIEFGDVVTALMSGCGGSGRRTPGFPVGCGLL